MANLRRRRRAEVQGLFRTDFGDTLALLALPLSDIGAMDVVCEFCRARRWKDEAPGLCCGRGRVVLPDLDPLPPLLDDLISGHHPLSNHFLENVRLYNAALNLVSCSVRSEKVFADGPQAFKPWVLIPVKVRFAFL